MRNTLLVLGLGACAIGAVLIAARQQVYPASLGSPAPDATWDRSISPTLRRPVDTERMRSSISARPLLLAKPDHARET